MQYENIRTGNIGMEIPPGRKVHLAIEKLFGKKGKAVNLFEFSTDCCVCQIQLQLISVLLALATLWQIENNISSFVYLIYLLSVTLIRATILHNPWPYTVRTRYSMPVYCRPSDKLAY